MRSVARGDILDAMPPRRCPLPMLIAIVVALVLAVRAQAAPAHIVVDAETGSVLQESSATHRWHPASLTKLMTVFLALEAIAAGRLSLDEPLAISAAAAGQSEFKLGLQAGRTIRTREAIVAVLQRSANDAAAVLAERVAGSEAAFALLMTARARDLGMSATQFRNATGLPDPLQITTARDMAILIRALVDAFPQHADLFTAPVLHYDGRSWPSLNGLLTSYPGTEAVKTGFTCDSGYNIAASAKRGGRRLITVVLGGKSKGERNALAAKLLSSGFAAPASARRTLADLRDAANAPPHVLPPGECVASRGAPSSSGGGGSEWALLLGTFATQADARSAIAAAKANLPSGARAGVEIVTPREREGARAWTAALGPLSRAQATGACKQLWESDLFCRPLPRALLASEKVRRRS